jgi:hypothetical protein
MEKLALCLVFLCGQLFVVYVLSQFRKIMEDFEEVAKFNQKHKSLEADEIALQSWLVLLTRYRDNKPLPISLETQIYQHFRYFWLRDRLPPILELEFMDCLPSETRRSIVVNYIFDDVLHSYRQLLRPQDPMNAEMIETLIYGLMPRHFSSSDEKNVIYDEGMEVLEMYFIQSGQVGAGFKLFDQPLSEVRYQLTHSLLSKEFFGDFYVMFNIKAEFCFLAEEDVQAFALSKKFLLYEVFGCGRF